MANPYAATGASRRTRPPTTAPMPGAGTEVELKFQLPPARRAALERALATRTAERIRLRARYFDTDDGRLAAAQMALRLRLEGDRWVQTLKGRGDGLLRRLEDEVPVAGAPDAPDAPPPLDPRRHDGTEAGRALRAALAGAPAPTLRYGTDIVRLRRVLRHAGARVEVALDVGELIAGERAGEGATDDASEDASEGAGEDAREGRAAGGARAAARAPVCEVEFELLDGPAQALFELAGRWAERYGLVLDVTTKAERGERLARGEALAPVVRATDLAIAPALPLGQARAQMIGAALAHALPNASALVAGAGGPDHVHQLRVGLRRLRTVLRAFGPADAARDEAVARLFATLGGTRDADVMAATLAPAWAAAAAAGLSVPPAGEMPASDAALAVLRAPAAARLWLQLLALAQPPGAAPPSAAADPGVPGGAATDDTCADDATPWVGPAAATVARWRRTLRRGLRDWARLDDAHRHRLRKRLKRLRYLLDFADGLWPAKAMAAELGALRPLQEALGRWNDLVVARAHVAALSALAAETAPAHRPALHFAAGWLAREAGLADAACLKAVARWRRLPPLKAPKTPKSSKPRRRR
jgi:triphosphatase